MATAFDPHRQAVDLAVDAAFGEDVRLLPYKEAGGGFSDPVPDSSRTVRNTTAYIIGRGTFLRGNSELTRMRASADWLMSITEDNVAGFRKGDRVILMDRDVNQVYELGYREESSNRRPRYHLIKVKK